MIRIGTPIAPCRMGNRSIHGQNPVQSGHDRHRLLEVLALGAEMDQECSAVILDDLALPGALLFQLASKIGSDKRLAPKFALITLQR